MTVPAKRRGGLAVAAAALLAAALLGGGLPRLVAATATLAGDPAVALIQAGERPTAAGVARVLDGRATALAWAPTGRAEVEIGSVLLALAATAGADEPAVLEGAAARLRAGLTRAPADARGWHLLAGALATLERPDEAATALAISYRADPHTTQLDAARIVLATRLWDRLAPETRGAALLEQRTAFRLHPVGTLRLALRTDALAHLREALAGDRADAQALEILLEDHRAALG